jgi:hypothetical protein
VIFLRAALARLGDRGVPAANLIRLAVDRESGNAVV